MLFLFLKQPAVELREAPLLPAHPPHPHPKPFVYSLEAKTGPVTSVQPDTDVRPWVSWSLALRFGCVSCTGCGSPWAPFRFLPSPSCLGERPKATPSTAAFRWVTQGSGGGGLGVCPGTEGLAPGTHKTLGQRLGCHPPPGARGPVNQ